MHIRFPVKVAAVAAVGVATTLGHSGTDAHTSVAALLCSAAGAAQGAWALAGLLALWAALRGAPRPEPVPVRANARPGPIKRPRR